MRDNAVAMQHDLHVGGGDTIRDLAVAFGVPDGEFDDFARLLHDNRSRLAPLAEPGEINETSAQLFQQLVFREIDDRGIISEYS